ncbi:ubiquitin-related modifier 1 isoform X1 [Stegastes partitus]|uniref:Ubiquitin-related modifier 1 n=1 Tax=Stegastes partitus TaxID=144197 RepID=A0A3B4Z427_9TELE|nr:PREDICTED: ubiquitin-related modifier 1 isoform X1 [Stegastes partitus]
MAAPIAVHLEFGGGAELLFNGVKEHHVTLPSQSEPWDMKQLLVWIQRNLLKERPELFVQGDSVRPGILVLINDADWELMNQNACACLTAAGLDCSVGLKPAH